ncbi:MAG: rRNA pseudouridine synthase [Deltaproteobacteria bacterium]|nr:rRNA pseudouridine synthase [Deltaproteobacteria bacterium]
MNQKIRLQKIIANAGLASRREAERLIVDGQVTVNGKRVVDLGTKVDPEDSHIKVKGKLIRPESRKVYLMLNKPDGFVTTMKDPEGRPTVISLIHRIKERVTPVGRLDFHTEGLLLLTNDGNLAQAITHPAYHLPKVYRAKVKGKPSPEKLQKLRRGIRLKEGMTAPIEIKKIKNLPANVILEITLHEGKNRQIRRMFESIGHPILKLTRTRIGPLPLGSLAPGKFRKLDPWEVEKMKTAVREKPVRKKS